MIAQGRGEHPRNSKRQLFLFLFSDSYHFDRPAYNLRVVVMNAEHTTNGRAQRQPRKCQKQAKQTRPAAHARPTGNAGQACDSCDLGFDRFGIIENRATYFKVRQLNDETLPFDSGAWIIVCCGSFVSFDGSYGFNCSRVSCVPS